MLFEGRCWQWGKVIVTSRKQCGWYLNKTRGSCRENKTYRCYPIITVVTADKIETFPYLVRFHIASPMIEVLFPVSYRCHPGHQSAPHTPPEVVSKGWTPPLWVLKMNRTWSTSMKWKIKLCLVCRKYLCLWIHRYSQRGDFSQKFKSAIPKVHAQKFLSSYLALVGQFAASS